MAKPSSPKKPKNEQEAYLKRLEEENYWLRLELDCLKGLRRLRLEEEAAQKKKQGSHTASEDLSTKRHSCFSPTAEIHLYVLAEEIQSLFKGC